MANEDNEIVIESSCSRGEEYFYPVIGGKKYSYIAETEDMAMLIALAIKYDGLNSQFPKMAARMLNIDTKWRE